MIWMIFIKKIEEYSANKKQKILIVLDDLITISAIINSALIKNLIQ